MKSPHSTPEEAAAAAYLFDMLAQLGEFAEARANEPEIAILIKAIVATRAVYVERFSPLVKGLKDPAPSGEA
jgi:fructoselysine-6-P-deglycase FrlB-like protein